jgi:hypothetical protein
MSDTPRTNNAAGDGTTVPADFAADLERELNEAKAEVEALRADAERWKFICRHSWKDLHRVRVLAFIKADSVLGPNWQDAVDDLLEAAGTTEQAIAARAALAKEKA